MGNILFRDQGYRFMFSQDVQRMHEIIFNWDGEARFWLDPEVELESNDRFTRLELEDTEALVRKNRDRLLELWRERHSV